MTLTPILRWPPPSRRCGRSDRRLCSCRSLSNEPSVLLPQRTTYLNDHARQISFPGGKIDAGDASPVAAALREAEEEIAPQFRRSGIASRPYPRAAWLFASSEPGWGRRSVRGAPCFPYDTAKPQARE